MTTRSRPTFTHVQSWILARIDDGTIKPNERIPTIRAISQVCYADKETVQAVIGTMKKDGILFGEKGMRLRLVATLRNTSNTPSSNVLEDTADLLTPHTQIRARLLNGILTGEYAAGEPLPAIKALRHALDASPRTLHAALKDLLCQGTLTMKGRRYLVKASVPTKPIMKVTLVTFTYHPSGPGGFIQGHHDKAICGQLSAACAGHNVRLEIAQSWVESCSNLRVGFDGHAFAPDDTTLGYVVLLNMFPPTVKDLFDLLARTGKPIAVIDQFGDWNINALFPPRIGLQVFTFSNGYHAAREMVKALIQYGHRAFLFVSPYPYAWSHAREKGVRDELNGLGLAESLSTFTFDLSKEPLPPQWEEAKIPMRGFQEFMTQQVQCIKDWPRYVREPLSTPLFLEGIWGDIMEERAQIIIRQRLSAVAKSTTATAWIAVNDLTCISALDTLRENAIDVPRSTSLVSFDDSDVALQRGLSSWNFNVPNLVNAVLNFVLAPKSERKDRGAGRIDIPGLLVERNTSRPACGKE